MFQFKAGVTSDLCISALLPPLAGRGFILNFAALIDKARARRDLSDIPLHIRAALQQWFAPGLESLLGISTP